MIVGHERQVGYLDSVLRRGRLAHAYLFHGPESVGKLTAARALAAALFCKNMAGQPQAVATACGACADCAAIEADSHPAVMMLDLAHSLTSDRDDRSKISIKDIQELRRRFSFVAAEGQWRIAIINQADTMSDDAANALLKILEEPGPRTLIILITSFLDGILPTVASRAHAIRFSEVLEEKIAEFLLFSEKMRDEKTARQMARSAHGRPGRAIRYAQNPAEWSREKDFLVVFSAAVQAGIPEMFAMAKDAAGDDGRAARAAEEIIRLIRAELCNPARRADARRLAKKIRAADRISTILKETNVNPRLALDAMFLELAD